DRAPSRGPDRGDEILFAAVAEFYFPGNGRLVFFAAHADTVAERGEIGIAAAVNGKLRAGFDAGIALPAHVRLDVERAPIGGVDMHDVGWADIDTVSAAVAARHINEGGHDVSLSVVSTGGERRFSNAAHALFRRRIFSVHRRAAANCSSCRWLRPPFFPARQPA